MLDPRAPTLFTLVLHASSSDHANRPRQQHWTCTFGRRLGIIVEDTWRNELRGEASVVARSSLQVTEHLAILHNTVGGPPQFCAALTQTVKAIQLIPTHHFEYFLKQCEMMSS